ncbi:MAG: aminoglycoside phosphotransferase family protein [Kiritimatiellae bacterium]|jgi:aminoglycoside phosphotransferase (APT) family kinase protein|nr:aminoglycoside phosphotransferase family protein [Kiritimatiellia bacterium]
MTISSPISQDRTDIYYWKCDRAAAFHGTDEAQGRENAIADQLLPVLKQYFSGLSISLSPANGQGNHRTFKLTIDAFEAFVRTEDGPENDNYFDVESLVYSELLRFDIPVPRVLACDCDRTQTPFAWQVLEYIPYADLNFHAKKGDLVWGSIGRSLGASIARWQELKPSGFGPFSASEAHTEKRLRGVHSFYRSYFLLNLQRHLDFLKSRSFLSESETDAISAAIAHQDVLLDLEQGCLVHKDFALWNILGSCDRVEAFIDWDDTISGDPMDDLSLLACFYDAPVLEYAFAGYSEVRSLPENYMRRFWLHLLRNMLVKAVIRIGAEYFTRGDQFYLIGSGSNGSDLESFTRARIQIALRGLTENCNLSILK